MGAEIHLGQTAELCLDMGLDKMILRRLGEINVFNFMFHGKISIRIKIKTRPAEDVNKVTKGLQE